VFANLDIANTDFLDFVDEERGVQDDGTWVWHMSSDTNEGLERVKGTTKAKKRWL
jgi:hypothetical protein